MTETLQNDDAARTILLATDLSARCDRALDRAARLSREWGGRLVVLHVLDPAERFLERRHLDYLPAWRRPAERQRLVERRLRRDLGDTVPSLEVRVVEGDPAERIVDVAQSSACDLVVTGVARDETLGRALLGSTVDRLVRHSPVPVLVVRRRGAPYGKVLVAIDFSESSRHALDVAARLFPDAALTLAHAFDPPFAGLLDDRSHDEGVAAAERAVRDTFLAGSALSDEQRRRLEVVIAPGKPETMIRTYMEDNDIDLVVLGTHGRSAVFEVLIGSTAKRLLEGAPGDVLLVRDPRSIGVD